MVSRAETADSVDWMNETIMSRDMHQNRHNSGVPALDISLDADHIHWLKEQSQKAQFRASYSARTRSDGGSDLGSLRSVPRREGATHGTAQGRGVATMNGTAGAAAELMPRPRDG